MREEVAYREQMEAWERDHPKVEERLEDLVESTRIICMLLMGYRFINHSIKIWESHPDLPIVDGTYEREKLEHAMRYVRSRIEEYFRG